MVISLKGGVFVNENALAACNTLEIIQAFGKKGLPRWCSRDG